VNAELWRIEDDIRAQDGRRLRTGIIALARVYQTNDKRAALSAKSTCARKAILSKKELRDLLI